MPPELLEDVVVHSEFFRGEKEMNSDSPWASSRESSWGMLHVVEMLVPLVVADSSWMSSGVDGFGGVGPLATKSGFWTSRVDGGP